MWEFTTLKLIGSKYPLIDQTGASHSPWATGVFGSLPGSTMWMTNAISSPPQVELPAGEAQQSLRAVLTGNATGQPSVSPPSLLDQISCPEMLSVARHRREEEEKKKKKKKRGTGPEGRLGRRRSEEKEKKKKDF